MEGRNRVPHQQYCSYFLLGDLTGPSHTTVHCAAGIDETDHASLLESDKCRLPFAIPKPKRRSVASIKMYRGLC